MNARDGSDVREAIRARFPARARRSSGVPEVSPW